MRNKTQIGVCLAVLTSTVVGGALAISVAEPPSTPPNFAVLTPPFIPTSPKAGYVSLEYIVKFEDVKKLSPALLHATTLLRSGRWQKALAAFQAIQRTSPTEALAYRGENEASRFLNTLDTTIAHNQERLSAAGAHARPTSGTYLATLHYALGDAMSMKKYPTPIGEAPRDLGLEPGRHFLEAIRLKPDLLEAHLALAAYYEHRSQMHGTAARREYEIALRLRPDLYQIRYLHAASWDRPGVLGNEAQLRAHGVQVSDDEKSIPARAIAECLSLVRDHPSYPPPYYRLGSDYAFPLHDFTKARRYLAIYTKVGDPTLAWWQYATAEVQSIDKQNLK